MKGRTMTTPIAICASVIHKEKEVVYLGPRIHSSELNANRYNPVAPSTATPTKIKASTYFRRGPMAGSYRLPLRSSNTRGSAVVAVQGGTSSELSMINPENEIMNENGRPTSPASHGFRHDESWW